MSSFSGNSSCSPGNNRHWGSPKRKGEGQVKVKVKVKIGSPRSQNNCTRSPRSPMSSRIQKSVEDKEILNSLMSQLNKMEKNNIHN